jgi:hypothetical protein
MADQTSGGASDRRKSRTAVERTALCVLRADLPRLRAALSTYARCMAEVVTELSGSDEHAARRLDLLGSLRREHDSALADLDRIVDLLEAGGLTGVEVVEGEEDRHDVGRATDSVAARRRGWRDRAMRRCAQIQRKRSVVEG